MKFEISLNNLQDDLTNKFLAIFPSWTTMVATILALLILLLVLTKLVYRPIKKMYEERQSYIQENIDQAEKSNKTAADERLQADDLLASSQLEAASIIANAKDAAQKLKGQEMIQAQKEARALLDKTKKSIVLQQQKFEQDSKEAIIEVALEAAAKVVEKSVDSKSNRKVISDFVDGKKT